MKRWRQLYRKLAALEKKAQRLNRKIAKCKRQ